MVQPLSTFLQVLQKIIDKTANYFGIPSYLVKLGITLLLVIMACMVIYGLSRHLSRRSLFNFDLSKIQYLPQGKANLRIFNHISLYILKYLVLFPIYTLIWGTVFLLFLILLVVPSQYANIMFFTTIVIALIRFMAYYNEEYAEDLAKVLPLWLLVTLMLDPSILGRVELSIDFNKLFEGQTIVFSIIFIVVEEWILRAVYIGRKAWKSDALT